MEKDERIRRGDVLFLLFNSGKTGIIAPPAKRRGVACSVKASRIRVRCKAVEIAIIPLLFVELRFISTLHFRSWIWHVAKVR